MTTTVRAMIDYTRGEWFNEYFSFVLKQLNEKQVEVMVDLGSCLGEVSKIIMENVPSVKKIIAIEALPTNFENLKQNLKSDKVDITYVNRAIYYGKEIVSMGNSLSNIGGFSVRDENIYNNQDNITDNILTARLEDVIGDLKVDFIKIDIEGAEKNILENTNVLNNIGLIELELHDYLAHPDVHLPFLQQYLPNHKLINHCYRWGGGNNVLLEKTV